MPYVDPQSVHNPTTGQIATAAWGDAVRDALQYLSGGFPHCSILESTAQSVSNSTATDLTSNEENSDIGGMHSTSSNTERVTVPAGEGGLYRADSVVNYALDADGYRVLNFKKNGTTDFNVAICPVNSGAVQTVLSGGRSLVLVAGDYLTVNVFHNAGAALNITMLDFSVRWIATA